MKDSGSQKVQHRFGGFKHKVRIISTAKMIHLENSSDLEQAPGARSIAAEFSKCNIYFLKDRPPMPKNSTENGGTATAHRYTAHHFLRFG